MTFLKLTAPNADRTPVYIKADDISLIRAPIDGAQEANTVLYVFGIPQYVRETPEQILDVLTSIDTQTAFAKSTRLDNPTNVGEATYNQTQE